MGSVMSLIFLVLQIFQFVLLARVLLSWFPDIDRNNPLVRLLYDITEPVLRPVRERLPQNGPMDFSPLVVFLGIYVLMTLLRFV
jgi:YggT family protein